MRFFLVEAAQVTARSDAEWRRKYFHLAQRRGKPLDNSLLPAAVGHESTNNVATIVKFA
jgi:hypothetical protein